MNGRHFPRANGHIRDLVYALRRIDNTAAAKDEVVVGREQWPIGGDHGWKGSGRSKELAAINHIGDPSPHYKRAPPRTSLPGRRQDLPPPKHLFANLRNKPPLGASNQRLSMAPKTREMRKAVMYHHVKELMYTVHVGTPEPRFGNMLLEQFGGPNGELAAALQYSIQGLNCEDEKRKDMLMDIGTEEISHLEVIGTLARMHLKSTKNDRRAAEANPLISICGGGGVALVNSTGVSWTADYLKISGQLEVDLRNNIAAEARAKITYERLIDFCDDPGSKDALMFLMTREIAHMKSFLLALQSLGKDPLEIGQIPPRPEVRQQIFQRFHRNRSGRRYRLSGTLEHGWV